MERTGESESFKGLTDHYISRKRPFTCFNSFHYFIMPWLSTWTMTLTLPNLSASTLSTCLHLTHCCDYVVRCTHVLTAVTEISTTPTNGQQCPLFSVSPRLDGAMAALEFVDGSTLLSTREQSSSSTRLFPEPQTIYWLYTNWLRSLTFELQTPSTVPSAS